MKMKIGGERGINIFLYRAVFSGYILISAYSYHQECLGQSLVLQDVFLARATDIGT